MRKLKFQENEVDAMKLMLDKRLFDSGKYGELLVFKDGDVYTCNINIFITNPSTEQIKSLFQEAYKELFSKDIIKELKIISKKKNAR